MKTLTHTIRRFLCATRWPISGNTRTLAQATPQTRGMALVMVLSAIVLVTFLTVAFFSKASLTRQIAFTSTGQLRSDQIARSALDIIVGELRQEIASEDNSEIINTDANDPNGNPVRVYYPRKDKPEAIAPQFTNVTPNTNPTTPSNIIKISGENPFYSGGRVLGSSLATDEPSKNRRRISDTKWFGYVKTGDQLYTGAPYLGKSDQLPNWAILTRSGLHDGGFDTSLSNRSSSQYAIGRFAFTVYDVSGLLDVNVAGIPKDYVSQDGTKALREGKGHLATALTTDATIADQLLSGQKLESIADWRNPATKNFVGGADRYQLALFNRYLDVNQTKYNQAQRSGFTQINTGDRTILSRKDLLRFSSSDTFSLDAQKAQNDVMPRITHFTREVASPTFRGTKMPRGDYDPSQAGVKTDGNQDVADVRVVSSFTRINGETAVVGEPLVKHRFPLERIAWLDPLANNGVKSGAKYQGKAVTPDLIKKAFGLERVISKATIPTVNGYTPIYHSGKTDAGSWKYMNNLLEEGKIKTLKQVASEGREPNFFELLKAGIHSGSIGIAPAGDTVLLASNLIDSSKNDLRNLPDTQIIQIGANIIDQYDSDSLPTQIDMMIKDNRDRAFFGAENVPYIFKLHHVAKRMITKYQASREIGDFFINDNFPDEPKDLNRLGCFVVPELWSGMKSSPNDSPATIRLSNSLAFPTRLGRSETADVSHRFTFTGTQSQVSFIYSPNQAKFSNPFFIDRNMGISGNLNFIYTRTDLSSVPFTDQIFGFTAESYYMFYPIQGNKLSAQQIATNKAKNDYLSKFRPWNMGSPQSINKPPQWGLSIDLDRNVMPIVTAEVVVAGKSKIYQVLNIGMRAGDIGDFVLSNGIKGYVHDGKSENTKVPRYVGDQATPSGTIEQANWAEPHIFTSFAMIDPRTTRMGMQGIEDNPGNQSDKPGAKKLGLTPPYQGPRTEAWPQWRASRPQTRDINFPKIFNPSTTTGLAGWERTMLANLFHNPQSGSPAYKSLDQTTRPTDAKDNTLQQNPYATVAARPVILNRPFRNVAEIGYAFRDLPWTSVNLSSANSADGGLLDLFCVGEIDSPVRAGVISPNTSSAASPAFMAMLFGAQFDVTQNNSALSAAQVQGIAKYLADPLSRPETFKDDNQTPGKYMTNRAWLTALLEENAFTNNPFTYKRQRESVARALADVINTRTWNLTIDVIAQAGRYPDTATGLRDFVVEGERRYWLHVAIDRHTGEIVDRQLEVVTE